jgi:hypothetical protein
MADRIVWVLEDYTSSIGSTDGYDLGTGIATLHTNFTPLI